MAGKGSKRRPALISREEETLRYDLAFGKITFEEWVAGMQKLKAVKDSKGVCCNCLDGLMVDCAIDYGVVCRLDSITHHRWYTCSKFREDE